MPASAESGDTARRPKPRYVFTPKQPTSEDVIFSVKLTDVELEFFDGLPLPVHSVACDAQDRIEWVNVQLQDVINAMAAADHLDAAIFFSGVLRAQLASRATYGGPSIDFLAEHGLLEDVLPDPSAGTTSSDELA